ncbi:MAG: MBL fold metallo-hydrolase [Bosea sp.]|uniref:MBL fold metallo-hydrolase n=1 Tax=Bosea sp. (in: a-proteobacteria) TaxID=1871050 RepID=UPI0010F55E1E|nr:MBL fold metallo-hydrolase [Bosea sp. (in: a-proteobacteria)]MCP4734853.1 MBL fold metallo-hydrolase [Bosea sp. (in: a-proteobacteria)]
MMQSRQLGDLRITRVLEYSAPTHPPEFLFPDLPAAQLAQDAAWLAPAHYVQHMSRLIVTIQLWIVHAGDSVILIDTGVGNLKPRGPARMNMLNSLVLPWLEAAGAGRDQVTHVVHTHLHSDHIGWNTLWVDGRWEPTFPKARYFLPKQDFDHFQTVLGRGPNPLIDNSFADSLYPVIEAGLADFITEAARDVAGVLAVEPAPGHSPGMLSYRLRSGGEEAIFTADVFHSPLQIAHPDLNTAYCELPDVARKTRLQVLQRATDREALILPMHFGAPHCGYVRRQGEGFRFEPASW